VSGRVLLALYHIIGAKGQGTLLPTVWTPSVRRVQGYETQAQGHAQKPQGPALAALDEVEQRRLMVLGQHGLTFRVAWYSWNPADGYWPGVGVGTGCA
jgi:hypothetical protein